MNNPIFLFRFIIAVTLFFCFALAFDVTPLLRGPAPYPPEWRWEYLFINTAAKIYLTLAIMIIVGGLFWFQEKKKIFTKKILLLLTSLIILSFLFQISILFFSRSGIPVLIHRIINPELNSYFTASLQIENPIEFFKNYDEEMKQFVYHARSHPPGAIFIFYLIKQILIPFTGFINFANSLVPLHTDVKLLWNSLFPIDKATAVFSAFFLPFLSTLTIIPLFKTAKRLYGEKVAIRSSFLFLFIPSIVLFIPIHDVFLPFFSVGAFYFLVKGLQEKNSLSFFLSGIILFSGVTFNLALLPLLIFFFSFAIMYILKNNLAIKHALKKGLIFSLGFFLPPILLYIFFDFNFIHLIQMILQEVVHLHTRSYSIWLFYNVFDFFIFIGIPLAIIFLIHCKDTFFFILQRKWSKLDLLFSAFLIMFLILDLSGSTRGETGRIWAIFMPFVILPAVVYLTNKRKFSTKLFIGFLLLQGLQILIMQEFWVVLW